MTTFQPQPLRPFVPLPLVFLLFPLTISPQSINSRLHVFGHTHINWDKTIDGVRYVQTALKYPRERQRMGGLWGHADLSRMVIFDAHHPPDWYTGEASGCAI